MGKKPAIKTVTLDMKSPLAKRKLSNLLADGWEILDSQKRGALQWKPGQIDYTLIKKG